MHKLTEFSRRKILVIGLLVLLLAFSTTYFFLHEKSSNLDNVDAVVRLVGRHYLLPTNEMPALATVEDTSKLSSEFFRSAKVGDKLLIYKNAKKVLLYRPSIDKLVEVGPVSIATDQATEQKQK